MICTFFLDLKLCSQRGDKNKKYYIINKLDNNYIIPWQQEKKIKYGFQLNANNERQSISEVENKLYKKGTSTVSEQQTPTQFFNKIKQNAHALRCINDHQ